MHPSYTYSEEHANSEYVCPLKLVSGSYNEQQKSFVEFFKRNSVDKNITVIENTEDGMKRTELRRNNTAGALIFSICGLFCGQSPDCKFQVSQKVKKIKIKPPFLTKKSGFCGAAIRI